MLVDLGLYSSLKLLTRGDLLMLAGKCFGVHSSNVTKLIDLDCWGVPSGDFHYVDAV